jgi:hypothetical protein
MCLMTVELKRWHRAMFIVLLMAQLGGYVLFARSSLVIFTADFLQRAGWVTRFMIPASSAISVSFTVTATIANRTQVFAKRK